MMSAYIERIESACHAACLLLVKRATQSLSNASFILKFEGILLVSQLARYQQKKNEVEYC